MPLEPLAMFPLAAVVFPTTELPLHVFERRYQQLTRDVLATTGEFGICLISRGSEVGGGDERVSIGTRVRVELAAPLEGERWILVTHGVERVRVEEWLDDDPYPRALVEPLPSVGAAAPHDVVLETLCVVKALRRLQSEFADGPAAPCVDVCLDDAASAAWMLCAMSPLPLFDLQQLLEVPGHTARLALLRALCDAKRQDLESVLRLDAPTVSEVRLVELDDVATTELRQGALRSRPTAPGFPRHEDLEALRARERGAASFLVVADGLVVGTCGTHGQPGSDGAVELGWGLVEAARGRGVGTAAVALLLEAVRARHPGTPLVAHTEWRRTHAGALVADSPASEALLARLGFTGDPAPREPGYRAWRLPAD